MRNKLICLILYISLIQVNTFGNLVICSWNLCNLGKSKSESEIEYIANTLKTYDIIAIQEVVAGEGGADAVARLAEALNRKGSKWDYSISDPTTSSAYKTERYAFIWKTSNASKLGDAWLEKQYNLEIDREPYFATFQSEGKVFTLVNFHAITKSRQPETEIKYFKFLPAEYPSLNLIFTGDFNCPQSHSVFNPLKKMGYKPSLIGQKTSLRQKCINDDCLASEFDNIFYNTAKVNYLKSGVVRFFNSFNSLKEARTISDHIPIWFEFTLK